MTIRSLTAIAFAFATTLGGAALSTAVSTTASAGEIQFGAQGSNGRGFSGSTTRNYDQTTGTATRNRTITTNRGNTYSNNSSVQCANNECVRYGTQTGPAGNTRSYERWIRVNP